MHEVAPVNKAARGNSVDDEPCRDKRIEPAGTADAEFLRVECDVVGYRPVGETHEDEVHELRDGAREEEPVKRKRGVRFLLFRCDLERLHQNKSDYTQDNGNREDDVVAEGLVQEHARHGACREGQIHADSEVADAFTATARRESVDGDRVARRRRNPEA